MAGVLSEPQLSLSEGAKVLTWCFPKCLLLEHVDWGLLWDIQVAVYLYSFIVICSLLKPNVNESGFIELLCEGLAEDSRFISALFRCLSSVSLLPGLASHFLPFFSLLTPFCSRLLLSPSRLLIRNHQIVSVTMSSVTAKALVIIPATQGENDWGEMAFSSSGAKNSKVWLKLALFT